MSLCLAVDGQNTDFTVTVFANLDSSWSMDNALSPMPLYGFSVAAGVGFDFNDFSSSRIIIAS